MAESPEEKRVRLVASFNAVARGLAQVENGGKLSDDPKTAAAQVTQAQRDFALQVNNDAVTQDTIKRAEKSPGALNREAQILADSTGEPVDMAKDDLSRRVHNDKVVAPVIAAAQRQYDEKQLEAAKRGEAPLRDQQAEAHNAHEAHRKSIGPKRDHGHHEAPGPKVAVGGPKVPGHGQG